MSVPTHGDPADHAAPSPHDAVPLRSLFDRVAFGVVYQDADGRILDANASGQRILGLTLDQMQGRTSMDPRWRSIREDGSPFPGSEHPAMQALATGRDVSGVVMGVVHATGGETRWIVIDAFPECAPGESRPRGVYATFRDITERRRAEEQAQRWQHVFDQTELALAIADPRDNTFIAVNPTFATQRGYTVEELVGKPVDTLYSSEQQQEVRRRFPLIDHAGHYTFESVHVRKDGTTFPVLMEVTTVHDARGEVQSRVAYALDITDRRRDEEALRESEHALRSLFDAIPESVFLMDTDGLILAANETFAVRLGRAVEELIGTNVYDALPAETAARRRAIVAQAVASGVPVVFEDERDGFRLQHHICPIPNPGGAVGRVVVFAVDMTERRRMEDQIRSERSRLRVALEAAHAGAFDWDVRLERVHWTEEMFALYGLPPDTTPSVGLWLSMVHPDDVSRLETAIGTAFATGVYDQDFRLVRPDGVERWISARGRVTYDADGQPARIAGINMDVTERRHMLAELRESNARYRHLVDTSFDWVWEVDADSRYTFASERVRDLLGYEPSEILGKTPFDLMPDDEARRVLAHFVNARAERLPIVALENVNLHRSGRVVVLETSAVPMFGAGNEFLGYRGMDRDVTTRKQLEAQLRQSQKLEAIGQLAGGVAHDFNNILAATMMHISLLQMQPDLTAEMRGALSELDAEAQRAASLTRQLLMFSRRSVLDARTLDVNEVISNLLKMLRRVIGEHIDLRFDTHGGHATVVADAGMLEQVITNLVVNARDAMPRGGRVTIATTVETLGPVHVRVNPLRREGDFVCVSVSDTGEGMDGETMSRVFEPFFTTKEAGHGTGLGLATVHGIVAQHRGWIEVDSRVGIGTAFRVYLPAGTPKAVVAAADTRPADVRGGKETVLLVEDDAAVRRMASRTLAGLGYSVLEAANGQEAMRLWHEHAAAIDLLFTDMIMPEGMTGLELCEKLHAMKPALRTIISSGYSSEMVQTGVPTRAGVVYLPKPYELKLLASVVRECLDRG